MLVLLRIKLSIAVRRTVGRKKMRFIWKSNMSRLSEHVKQVISTVALGILWGACLDKNGGPLVANILHA